MKSSTRFSLFFALIVILLLSVPILAREANTPEPPKSINTLESLSKDNLPRITRLLRVGKGWGVDAAFDHDGEMLAIATSAGVWLYNTNDFSQEPRGIFHSGVYRVDFSPDGERIATAGLDGVVNIWHVDSAWHLMTLVGHKSQVYAVDYHPDGLYIASASSDRTVRLWDAYTGKIVRVFRGFRSALSDVEFSPDGTHILIATNDGDVEIWEINADQPLQSLRAHRAPVIFATYSLNGQRIVSGDASGTILVWNTQTHQKILELKGMRDYLLSLSYSPDGSQIIASDFSGYMYLWDAETGEVIERYESQVGGSVVDSIISPDGEWIVRVMREPNDAFVLVTDAGSSAVITRLSGYDIPYYRVAFDHEGERIISAFVGGRLKIWDSTTGAELANLEGSNGLIRYIHLHPYRSAFVIEGEYSISQIRDTATGVLLENLPDIHSIAISPDRVHFAIVNTSGEIELYDQSSMQTVIVTETSFYEVAYNHDGTRMLSLSAENEIQVWDPHNNVLISEMAGHADFIYTAEFSPDGQYLVSASKDGTARVWDAETGELIHILFGATESVNGAFYSPDGELIVSYSSTGVVHVWDANTGEKLRDFSSHPEAIQGAAISPDGTRIVTVGYDGVLEVWGVPRSSANSSCCVDISIGEIPACFTGY